jgi:hypothetical protein
MATVYLAEHPGIGKRVALKVIHPQHAQNEEMITRFFNEARAIIEVSHENVVEVLDFGQTPDGDNFIVMELLEGRTLGELLAEQPVLEEPRALHIAIQIADGLDAAHVAGIVHRDLKPDNIFLIHRHDSDDFVKVLDFGLAKLQAGVGALAVRTREGSVLGTPHYMAPEQCEGRTDIDHRVDVYGLGCLLYQMLCGRVPFAGGYGEVLVRHLREPPQLPSQINPKLSRGVEQIVLHALAKKKEFRFQSMKEMGEALRDPARLARALEGDVPLVTATMEVARQARQATFGDTPAPTLEEAAPTVFEDVPFAVQEAIRIASEKAAPDEVTRPITTLEESEAPTVMRRPPRRAADEAGEPPIEVPRSGRALRVGLGAGLLVAVIGAGYGLGHRHAADQGPPARAATAPAGATHLVAGGASAEQGAAPPGAAAPPTPPATTAGVAAQPQPAPVAPAQPAAPEGLAESAKPAKPEKPDSPPPAKPASRPPVRRSPTVTARKPAPPTAVQIDHGDDVLPPTDF